MQAAVVFVLLAYLSFLLTCLQVVQKPIERVPADRLSFISAFKGSVFELSTHPCGYRRALRRRFEHLGEEQMRSLTEELHKHTTNLMQDRFGVRRRSP
jgi:pumilio RNA-binding family